MTRLRRAAAVLLLLAVLAVGSAPARPVGEWQPSAHPPPTGVTLSGVDSHDGTMYQEGDLYYWVGSRYGCGFRYQDPGTPWCGFGVWTADEPAGPWSFVRNLFDPNSNSATWKYELWQTICRGNGCFNPRMIKRPDGVWILWFNAPRDLAVHQANQFWSMGCNGPAGPCGSGAGAPNGATFKPSIYACNPGGDFSIYTTGSDAYLFCTLETTRRVSVEKLASWWGSGSATGAVGLAGLQYVEGVGVARMSDGALVMTFGDNCPYCSATDTSYAVASAPLGPWAVPAGPRARHRIDGTSCGGQPRTLVTLGGQVYQLIDAWYDSPSETNAATRLEPLVRTGAPYLPAVNGQPTRGAFYPFTCE